MKNKTKNILVIVTYFIILIITIIGFLFINKYMMYGLAFLIPGFYFAILPLIKSVIWETKIEKESKNKK